MVNQHFFTGIDVRHLGDEGERIYHEKLKPLLEPQYKGKIIAIEVDSGDYFIGDTVMEALQKAKARYPEKIFHVIRVGFRAVHKRR